MWAIRGYWVLAAILGCCVLRVAEGQERRDWPLGQPLQPGKTNQSFVHPAQLLSLAFAIHMRVCMLTVHAPFLPDSFYVNPVDQVVERGSRVTMECIPKDLSDVVGVVWSFIDLTANPSRVFNVLTNNTLLGYYLVPHGEVTVWRDLVIPSVTDQHETGYQCLVYFMNDTSIQSYYSDVAELVIHGKVYAYDTHKHETQCLYTM